MNKFTVTYGYKYFNETVELGAIITEAESREQIEACAFKAVIMQISKDTESEDLEGISNISISILDGDHSQKN